MRASRSLIVGAGLGLALAAALPLGCRGRSEEVRPIPPSPAVWIGRISSSGAVGVAPVAAGTSAANIDLSGAGRWVLQRWVARRTGVLSALDVRIEGEGSDCRPDGTPGYGLGNGGSWHVSTHPVLSDGRPNMTRTLATQDFRPCQAPPSVADVRQGVVRLAMNLGVRQGEEYATIVANTDPAPSANYTSTNFLFTSSGLIGANARNERDPNAGDTYYGLDPRELVGFSTDAGTTWSLPGPPGETGFLPTYIQEYADGTVTGQPYYYTTPATPDKTMVFDHITAPWTIRALGAFTPTASQGTLILTIDGTQRAAANVTGPGMLRAPITPITIAPGHTVTVTAHQIPVANLIADQAWGTLMGMDTPTWPLHLKNEPNPTATAPIYALPAPPNTTTNTNTAG